MVIPAELTTTNNVTAIHCSDDAGLTNASCDNGNNNIELLPAAALGTSSIQEYIEDQRELDPDKKVPYILMLARGIHENVPMDVDIMNAEPFKTALAFNILKRKPLSLSKALLCQELKRRNPDRKMNVNNKKVDDLFSLLKEDDICDPADIAYIQGETTVYIDNLKRSIDDVEKKRKDSGGRIEASDRLRYISALDLDGSIREAYMRSQDVMNRQELDARNSVAAAHDFHSLISAKFNNIDWVPKTSVNADLHSYFAEEVACPKRDSYSNIRRNP